MVSQPGLFNQAAAVFYRSTEQTPGRAPSGGTPSASAPPHDGSRAPVATSMGDHGI